LLKELQEEYARKVSEKVTYETLVAQEKVDPEIYRLKIQSMTNQIKAIQKRLQEEARRIAMSTMVADPLAISQQLVENILQLESHIKGLRAKLEVLREVVDGYEQELAHLPQKAIKQLNWPAYNDNWRWIKIPIF